MRVISPHAFIIISISVGPSLASVADLWLSAPPYQLAVCPSLYPQPLLLSLFLSLSLYHSGVICARWHQLRTLAEHVDSICCKPSLCCDTSFIIPITLVHLFDKYCSWSDLSPLIHLVPELVLRHQRSYRYPLVDSECPLHAQ